jgi:hypothetical protein
MKEAYCIIIRLKLDTINGLNGCRCISVLTLNYFAA